MIAHNVVYHGPCLSNLYKKAAKAPLGDEDYSNEERKLHGIAFSQLISYMEDQIVNASDIIPVFKLSDLRKYYRKILENLGATLEVKVHSIRLKNRILAKFEDISVHTEAKKIIIVFNYDIGDAISTDLFWRRQLVSLDVHF